MSDSTTGEATSMKTNTTSIQHAFDQYRLHRRQSEYNILHEEVVKHLAAMLEHCRRDHIGGAEDVARYLLGEVTE